MLKVLSYLKKTWVSVVIIVLLLCVQAGADLALPSYTSEIVNVGIQAGGIENQAPEVIRKSQMENLLLFTSDDEEILNNYTLLSKDNLEEKEYEKLVKKYPLLETEEIYKQNKLKEEEQSSLNKKMTKPLMLLTTITSEETEEALKAQILQNVPEPQKSMMQNMTLMDILKSMPQEQLAQMLEEVNKKLDGMMGTVLDQAAIAAVKEEYKAIGMDTDKIQNDYILWQD